MTRTPDRAFRAAARDALIEHIDQQHVVAPPAGRNPSPLPPREWLRTAFATLLVGGAVAAAWLVVAGLQQGRPDLPRPAGAASSSTTLQTPASTPDPSPSSSASATISTDGSTRAPTENPGTTPALITPAGWHRVTRAELHAFVVAQQISADDPANQAIWEQEAWSDVVCMAAKGYVYDPVDQGRENLPASRAGLNSLTPTQKTDFDAALWGPSTDAPYAWNAAGCHGISVHEAGQDNAN